MPGVERPEWLLSAEGLRVGGVAADMAVRDAVPFGNRMGFIFVEADAWRDGRQAPGLALLRGDLRPGPFQIRTRLAQARLGQVAGQQPDQRQRGQPGRERRSTVASPGRKRRSAIVT